MDEFDTTSAAVATLLQALQAQGITPAQVLRAAEVMMEVWPEGAPQPAPDVYKVWELGYAIASM